MVSLSWKTFQVSMYMILVTFVRVTSAKSKQQLKSMEKDETRVPIWTVPTPSWAHKNSLFSSPQREEMHKAQGRTGAAERPKAASASSFLLQISEEWISSQDQSSSFCWQRKLGTVCPSLWKTGHQPTAAVPALLWRWAAATGPAGSGCGISAPCAPGSPERASACTPEGNRTKIKHRLINEACS